MAQKWFQYFEERVNEPLGYAPRTLAEKFVGNSYAEVEEFCTDVLRRRALELPGGSLKHIMNVKLKQWTSRAKPTKP